MIIYFEIYRSMNRRTGRFEHNFGNRGFQQSANRGGFQHFILNHAAASRAQTQNLYDQAGPSGDQRFQHPFQAETNIR